MVASSLTRDRMAARRLRPEQNSNSLLRELVSCFSQPEVFVVDLSESKLSVAEATFNTPLRRVLLGCEPEP